MSDEKQSWKQKRGLSYQVQCMRVIKHVKNAHIVDHEDQPPFTDPASKDISVTTSSSVEEQVETLTSFQI